MSLQEHLFSKSVDEIIDETIFEKNQRLEKMTKQANEPENKSIFEHDSSLTDQLNNFTKSINSVFTSLYEKPDDISWLDHIGDILSDKEHTFYLGILFILIAVLISLVL